MIKIAKLMSFRPKRSGVEKSYQIGKYKMMRYLGYARYDLGVHRDFKTHNHLSKL